MIAALSQVLSGGREADIAATRKDTTYDLSRRIAYAACVLDERSITSPDDSPAHGATLDVSRLTVNRPRILVDLSDYYREGRDVVLPWVEDDINVCIDHCEMRVKVELVRLDTVGLVGEYHVVEV